MPACPQVIQALRSIAIPYHDALWLTVNIVIVEVGEIPSQPCGLGGGIIHILILR